MPAAQGFLVSLELAALEERLDALGGADERHHDEDAEREQHRLQDVGAGVVEAEQDRERPATGKGRAEHLGANQDRRADRSEEHTSELQSRP